MVRVKTGGRRKGTPNKRQRALVALLQSMGICPAERLAALAIQAERDGDVRLASWCYARLVPFVFPKASFQAPAVARTAGELIEEARSGAMARSDVPFIQGAA